MEKLTKKQLQAVCDQKSIKYTSKNTKEELMKLLKKSKKAAPKAEVGKAFDGEF